MDQGLNESSNTETKSDTQENEDDKTSTPMDCTNNIATFENNTETVAIANIVNKKDMTMSTPDRDQSSTNEPLVKDTNDNQVKSQIPHEEIINNTVENNDNNTHLHNTQLEATTTTSLAEVLSTNDTNNISNKDEGDGIAQNMDFVQTDSMRMSTIDTSSEPEVAPPSPLPISIGMPWLNLQFHDKERTIIKKPDELENEMTEPNELIDMNILDRVQGSIIGMALGDALGAHVEFRPHQFLMDRPVTDLESGGTWGLTKGQFTDDTSMALCLANSLVACHGFNPYDQLVRYKWWFRFGYMSSTGHCFDIGAATSQSLSEFERRQKRFAKKCNISYKDMDGFSNYELLQQFDVYCSEDNVAGNGALMRLAPVPLFFYRYPEMAVQCSGISGQITHGDQKAYDACRYYGALIVAALHGYQKDQLLDNDFYTKHAHWFGQYPLHQDIELIAKGSYKKDGYQAGIRGKGYIVQALEAALWAFWSDGDSFEKGALAAVNLGDDTDTTAAIYGQLAGAYYGYQKLPAHWLEHVYARKFMEKLSKWIVYEGECYQKLVEAARNPIPTSSI